MYELTRNDTERQIRQLEARLAHQQVVARQLADNGFKGAAAQTLLLVETLQSRLTRTTAQLRAV